METATDLLTLGIAAVRIGGGLQAHHMHRLCVRGRIPYQRVGRLRLVRGADLAAIRREAIAAGYVREEVAHVA